MFFCFTIDIYVRGTHTRSHTFVPRRGTFLKVTFSGEKVSFRILKVTFSGVKVSFSDEEISLFPGDYLLDVVELIQGFERRQVVDVEA